MLSKGVKRRSSIKEVNLTKNNIQELGAEKFLEAVIKYLF